MTRLVLSLVFSLLYSTAAFAAASFQFAMPGIQAPKDANVQGMRFVLLHGKNERVGGLDLGFAAFSESVTQSGFTFNMGISKVSGSSSGGSITLVNVHEGADSGLNGSFVNIIKSVDNGINVGILNITEGTSNVDVGGLSMSKKSSTQLGFVNFTQEITNLQIGLLNFAGNGFFPVFPFFNYPKK